MGMIKDKYLPNSYRVLFLASTIFKLTPTILPQQSQTTNTVLEFANRGAFKQAWREMAALEVHSDDWDQQQQSHSSPSPIDTLPAELVREIILLSTSPDDQPRTIRLSHISSGWRDVCLSCTSLFVQADWEEWPVWLLQLWCTRANGRPLNVQLYWRGMRRIFTALREAREGGGPHEGVELLTLMRKTSELWSTLHADCGDGGTCNMNHQEHEECGTFLLANLPQLIVLSYTCCYSDLPPFSASLPNLRELDLYNFILDPLSHMPRLSVLTIDLDEIMTNNVQVSPWAKWLRELAPSSTPKELRIPSVDWFPSEIPERTSLGSIEFLDIQYANNMGALAYLFEYTQFPNLRSCTLSDIGGWGHPDHPLWLSDFFEKIVRHFYFTLTEPRQFIQKYLQTTAAPMLSVLCVRLRSISITSVQQTSDLIDALSIGSRVPSLSSLEVNDQNLKWALEENLAAFLLLKGAMLNALRELVDTHQLIKLSLPVISAAWIAEIEPRVGNITVRL